MGGSIRVVSEPGQGSSFEFELTFGWRREADPVCTATRFGGRLLVVDDSPTMVEVLTTMAPHLGFEVDHVANGEQALQAVVGAA